jgi:photosystem II stability/assembly factor-like uncharacterized protein
MMVALAPIAVGCNSATTDPCKSIAGTCVSLTVQSSTVATVDSLHILASGALTGDQTSSGGRANLPIVVALKLPANTSGSLDLHVDAFLTAQLVGSCDTDTLVTPGQHATAICTLVGVDNGGMDMATSGDDMTGGGGNDMSPKPCDPKGMTGPQCVWRWQNPLPQGDVVKAIVAFDDANTFMLSEDNLIFHRDATAWSMLAAAPPPPTTGLLGLSTLFGGGAGMDLYLGGTVSGSTSGPVVYHSTNSGASWVQEALPGGSTGSVGSGATTGKAAILPSSTGSAVFQRDATAGTWTSRVANSQANVSLNAVAMNANGAVAVGGISGSTAAISYSTNDGVTWTTVPTASITPSTEVLNGVCVGPNGTTNSYWAVGGGVILHGATNTPGTWASQFTAPGGTTLSGCVATDSTHAWAFGTNGSVFVTTNGTSWSAAGAVSDPNSWLTAGAHSSGTALLVGGSISTKPYAGALYRSTNAGTNFATELAGSPSEQLDAIYGVAPGVVYAAGSNGAIYQTSNDGATWTKLASTGSAAQLQGVWGASATDVYAVGSAGTIVHSTDGTAFTKYAGVGAPPATTFFQDVYGSPTLGVYAVGYDGTSTTTRVVYRTTDHGASWAQVTITGFTGAAGQLFTVFTLGSNVWVAGDGGNVYHSTDGANFTQQATGLTSIGITRMRGVTGQIIALLGTDPGTYISTVNNGVSWTMPTTSPLNDSPQNVAFTPDQSAVYVFGSFSGPIVSFDQFATWNFVPTAMNPNAVRNAFAFANNDVFVVGDTGIVHYGN